MLSPSHRAGFILKALGHSSLWKSGNRFFSVIFNEMAEMTGAKSDFSQPRAYLISNNPAWMYEYQKSSTV